MEIIVTGGTGVIGRGVIPALLARGHRVRLLTRHAHDAAHEWPEGVVPCAADVGDPATLAGTADGCDAVVHMAGIASETPPEVTFERVNVAGTRNVLAEAERAGVRRLVHVSSLGAERGRSAYHRSKLAGENAVRAFPGAWTILRPGNVYGPGDQVVSGLLRRMRALPVVPVVGRTHSFQPIWYEDLGAAVAAVVERQDLAGRVLELAGSEVTTVDELMDRFEDVSERSPWRLPLPLGVARAAVALAERLSLDRVLERAGLSAPADSSKLTMLAEGNVIRPAAANALEGVLGIRPTPLSEGLGRLASEQPEQLPDEGQGPLEAKRFRALIERSRLDADQLMAAFREEAERLLPFEFGGDGGAGPLVEGRTVTLELPLRGEVQVRVEEAQGRRVTLATLGGHPLAGVVRFSAAPEGERLRFTIEVFARAANVVDRVGMATVGGPMQKTSWEEAVRRVVERSGGAAPSGVEQERTRLEGPEAREVEAWIEGLVRSRHRRDNRWRAQPRWRRRARAAAD